MVSDSRNRYIKVLIGLLCLIAILLVSLLVVVFWVLKNLLFPPIHYSCTDEGIAAAQHLSSRVDEQDFVVSGGGFSPDCGDSGGASLEFDSHAEPSDVTARLTSMFGCRWRSNPDDGFGEMIGIACEDGKTRFRAHITKMHPESGIKSQISLIVQGPD
jgi:hypothetical protein